MQGERPVPCELEPLPSLEVLHIRACPLRSLAQLSMVCPALRVLNARQTAIASFRNLASFPPPSLPPQLKRVSFAGSVLAARARVYTDRQAELQAQGESIALFSGERPLDLAVPLPEPEVI